MRYYYWLVTAFAVMLAAFGCEVEFGPASSQRATVERSGRWEDTYCDHGNRVYTSGRDGIAVVPGGCPEETR